MKTVNLLLIIGIPPTSEIYPSLLLKSRELSNKIKYSMRVRSGSRNTKNMKTKVFEDLIYIKFRIYFRLAILFLTK